MAPVRTPSKLSPGRGRGRPACVAVLLAAALTASGKTAGAAWEPARWYAPIPVDGKVFPVALPAGHRWLNWRDTFGAPRMRLVGGTWRQVGIHEGIDIYAERGSPVVAAEQGVVENAGWTFYSGRRVGIRGRDGRYWFYAHLLKIAPGIAKGSSVGAGALLGFLGSSGYGPEVTEDQFPPHLHFGLQQGSTWVNPQSMLTNLYDGSVLAIRSAWAKSAAVELRMRLVRSRVAGPAAISPSGASAALERMQSLPRRALPRFFELPAETPAPI